MEDKNAKNLNITVLTNLSFQLYSFTAKKYFPSMGSRSKRIETFTEKKNCTQGVNTGNKKAGRDIVL